MHTDIRQLLDFYASPLGTRVRRVLSHHVRGRWRSARGMTVMGLGFASPFLGPFRGEVARLGALMPASQGAVVWPGTGPVHTVVVEETSLPIPDNSVDRMLVVHCLETSENVRGLLREVWRVLAAEGRVLFIVPNRRGVWARFDRTPFGHGRPYSPAQLQRLLGDALLSPFDWGAALHLPPVDNRLVLRSALTLERIGTRVNSAFAGVILVEARKEVMSPIAKTVPGRVTELVPYKGTA